MARVHNAVEPRPLSEIESYHAHIYYDPAASKDRAGRLRERVAERFPQARVGRWHDELVGPHLRSMYQVAFPSEMLAPFLPWPANHPAPFSRIAGTQ